MTPPVELTEAVSGSFRDPSGHVFVRDGRILRQINRSYAATYDRLMSSGLYRSLVDRGLLVPHLEVADPASGLNPDVHRVIAPDRVPFVSYPFEWAFGQLKAAARTTLVVHRAAIEHGMVLKDASAYNIQFRGASPVLIDTLSFESWHEGTPWIAYRQFCQHFLGPLALMSRADVRLGLLSRVFIDGVPLDLVAGLLPMVTKLSPSLLVHLHLHARAQGRHGDRPLDRTTPTRFTRRAMLGLVEHLESAVDGLTYRAEGTTWVDYYGRTNYSPEAMADKDRVVAASIDRVRPATVWDLGANTGAFSRLAAERGAYTVAFDGDPAAVERHYGDCLGRKEARVLPLVMDLANPTGPMGWSHGERMSLIDRGPADLVLALGLIHHLSLANHVPFGMAAEFFHRAGRSLLIEFVPRTDSQVAGMLSRMPRHDERYSQDAFEAAFSTHFDTVEVTPIRESERRLYLMRGKDARP
jgi:hypothetical protein